MNKFIVIMGKVIGGHTIRDLGITVPYQQSITIEAGRAAWSRDLNHAIQQKQVEKVKVITGTEASPVTPPKRRVKRVQPKPKHTTKAPLTDDLPDIPEEGEGLGEGSFAKSEALLEKSLEENEKLRKMNSDLMGAINQLIKQQEKFGDQFSEYMERPAHVAASPPPKNPHTTPSKSSDAVDGDAPAFIPSKIRTGRAKTSKGVGVSSESSKGSSFDDAANALAALRKKGDEDD